MYCDLQVIPYLDEIQTPNCRHCASYSVSVFLEHNGISTSTQHNECLHIQPIRHFNLKPTFIVKNLPGKQRKLENNNTLDVYQ